MRTTAEIVNYMTRHYQEKNGQIQEDLLPEKVNDLITKMGDFLSKRITEDTPHQAAWQAFVDQPEENAASLTGILETLFEAQPAVRDRIEGFMQAISAIEADRTPQSGSTSMIEESLKLEAGGLVSDGSKASEILADERIEKNPPAYLYGNERPGFESDRQAPVSKPFMIGKNAQIVYVPDAPLPFPGLFSELDQLIDTSERLGPKEKEELHQNLQIVRQSLTEEINFNDEKTANAIQTMWDVFPSMADALIESLKINIEQLPLETRDFIIQLQSPKE